MEKKNERLQSLLDRSRLEKSCYEMFYLQDVPVAEVARKTGLNRQTIYRYLRNFGATQEKCLALCETGTRAGGEASAFTPLLFCYVFAYAAAVSTTSVTKPHMYQPNIKIMFNRVNQH